MLQRQLIFISLFVLFVGDFAQQSELNGYDKVIHRQRRQVQPSPTETEQSSNKSNSLVNSGNNTNVDQQNVVGPDSSNQVPLTGASAAKTLASSTECKSDIQKYCVKGGTKQITNLKVLTCIDDLDNAVNLISKECQNYIYKYKYNMTHDVRFDDAAFKFCGKDIKLLDECSDQTERRGTGRLISCLYDLLDNITEPACRNFINQMQLIVFSDWRLSEDFATACLTDITQLKCGRVDDDKETIPHSQGAVLSCLSKSHDVLSKPCLKHISRLTEMQSDDYHLDRALYYACRDDRERLCPQVSSGNGRVYRCLYEQKFNSMMSPICREEIHRRQKLVMTNALLDVPLIRACKTEMQEHKCVVNPQDPDRKLSLINLLLCLENRIKKGEQINDECRRQMLDNRRMIMSDYVLSPDINSECKNEMVQHCPSLYKKGASGTIDQRGGRMIHCLLNFARKGKTFSEGCLSSIKALIRAVDPGSDVRADPLLETTCRSVIDTLCPRIKAGDSNIILCLLDNVKNTRMTDECEDRLMEISYFMVRDWRLTPGLVRTCRANLVTLCKLSQNATVDEKTDDVQVGTYIGCLYRQREQLNSDCRSELKRLMHIRAQSIGLMPEIEDNCVTDLATCKNPEVKGEEIKCLQKKYNKLEEKCKTAVRKLTKMTMSDPTLDFSLMKACESTIQAFCPNIESGKENDLLRCLIKQKNNQKMDYRCKAGVEHHQMISLQDAAFLSEQFRKKCKQETAEHCSGKITKASIIQCLARVMLQDVLKKQNQITEECRDELKFELLQRSESINSDPLLARVCQNDIRRLCPSQNPGNAEIIDCLKANRKNVSTACYNRLKQREKVDVVLPENDYSLTTKCSSVIQKFCANENKQNILLCLRRNANQDAMPNECRTVLYHRLMILNTDARFNKGLIENCQSDIDKHCQNEIFDDDNDGDDDDDNKGPDADDIASDGVVEDHDMGGRIIGCLREKYANKDIELERKCTTELIDVIQTSKLDIRFDVQLYQKCQAVLQSNCSGLDKEDCLKVLYQQKRITDPACKKQVRRIIKEGQADIHVDQGLTHACQADILKYCNDVPLGSGKQLQCLLQMSKSVTKFCRKMLLRRQELWSSISDVDDFDDLTRHVVNSSNNRYLFSVIFGTVVMIFLAGCVCRPCCRYRRVRKYKQNN